MAVRPKWGLAPNICVAQYGPITTYEEIHLHFGWRRVPARGL